MRNKIQLAITWRHFDFWLLGAVISLIIFGITMIRSAVAGNIELVDLNLVQRQIIFALIGLVLMVIVTAIDYRLWASISRPMYIVTIVVLATLSIVGSAFFGSARWFETGVINIQPSEIAKIVLIMVLADYFTRNMDHISRLRWVFRSFMFTLGITIWILLQPNLSTSIVMFVLWFAMLWASGLRIKHLLMFIGLGLVTPIAAFPFLADYQQSRILNFLFPDPNARYGEIYNIQQALIAIGSGGLLGQGYGHGASGSTSLSQGPLVRFYLFCNGAGVWICGSCYLGSNFYFYYIALFAGRPFIRRHIWGAAVLRRCHDDRISECGKYWCGI